LFDVSGEIYGEEHQHICVVKEKCPWTHILPECQGSNEGPIDLL